MNKIDRITELINKTKNRHNKNTHLDLSEKEINDIHSKYNELGAFKYINTTDLKIGKNIRYYDPKEDKLSSHCTIMNIDYYSIFQKNPKTLLLYSAVSKVQWKINPKKYIFFEQNMKLNNHNDYLRDQLEKYLEQEKMKI